MNLIINYDFFNAICDVNSGFTISKVFRNNKRDYLKYNIPIMTILEILIYKRDFIRHLPADLMLHFGIVLSMELIKYKILGDNYKEISQERLRELVILLEKIDVKTNYDLLKKSVIDCKIHNLVFNDNKIPSLVESKYILVPSFNSKNEICDTPIMQEHVIGSKVYTLRIAKPKKGFKLVHAFE